MKSEFNSLVDACAAITEAGYNKDQIIGADWMSPELQSLGSWLLANSGLPMFSLKLSRKQGALAIGMGCGIDSYIALMFALKSNTNPVEVIHLNYGQPYFEQEANFFKDLVNASVDKDCSPSLKKDLITFNGFNKNDICFRSVHRRIIPEYLGRDLDFSWKDYIVPARNLFLAAVCSQFASEIWIVATRRKDETVGTPDKTSNFYVRTSQVFTNFYRRSVLVKSPFLERSKADVVKEFLDIGGSEESLTRTFSCYSPVGDEHCGTCYACFKRYHLFQKFDIKFTFHEHPKSGKNWEVFTAKEEAKRGQV